MQATLQEYKDRATQNYYIQQNKKFYGLADRSREGNQKSLDSPRNPILEAFDKGDQQQTYDQRNRYGA